MNPASAASLAALLFTVAGTILAALEGAAFAKTIETTSGQESVVVTSVADVGDSSSTIPPTESSSTITTIPLPQCGDFNEDGSLSAIDALGILRTAVELEICADCICDVNDTATVSATDALAVLRVAVGLTGTLDCPSC